MEALLDFLTHNPGELVPLSEAIRLAEDAGMR